MIDVMGQSNPQPHLLQASGIPTPGFLEHEFSDIEKYPLYVCADDNI